MGDFVKVAKTNEIQPGQARLIDMGGKLIALFNVEGNYYAIDDTPRTRAARYRTARLRVAKSPAPWHGATFDIRTGQVLGPPAAQGVAHYGVRVTEGDILIEV